MAQTLEQLIEFISTTEAPKSVTNPIVGKVLSGLLQRPGYMGVATPATNPGTPDGGAFYIAGAGTYPNFGGVTVNRGVLAVFIYSGASWEAQSIDIASTLGSPEDEPAADSSAWSRIKNNAFLINRLKVSPADSFLVANEEKVYQSIAFIRVYSDEFIKLYPIVLTNNDSIYGTRFTLAYFDTSNVKREVAIVDSELLDGNLHSYDLNLSAISKNVRVDIQFVPNSFNEGVVLSNVNPVNYISINNFDVTTFALNQELEAHSICINRDWVSLTTKFESLKGNESKTFRYVKKISIKGYPQKTAEIGIFSLVINHSIYKYQFGIRMKVGEEFVSALKTKLDSFDEPFELRFNGIDLLIKIDVENVDELKDDDSKILVSEIGEPRLYLSPNCFVDYIEEDFENEISSLDSRINKNEVAIEDINVQLSGSGGLNMLKNPGADYSNAELKIISAIKNVGFYNVPEGIKEDDIFVRAFSAQSTVGSGAYGQQIYLANKRIYNETQNWGTASILIAPATPCDYQAHEFDVTVNSGEMKGMRIRMLVDYSVFSGTEFLYGTNINNKIVLNLDRTWYVPFGDRINTIESEVDELSKNGVYEKPMKQKNVVFLGSSNVWGDGFLFYSYLKEAVDWLYKSSGKFTAYNKAVADNPIIVSNLDKNGEILHRQNKKQGQDLVLLSPPACSRSQFINLEEILI